MGPCNPKKNWFLTYSQNDSTKEAVVAHLESIDELQEYIVCQEKHKDGGNHLHAYVKYKTGVKVKDVMKFHIDAKGVKAQPCRSCRDVIKYCTKEGDYLANFDVEKYQAKKGKVSSEVLRTYTTIEALDAGIIGLNSMKAFEYARSLAINPKEREDVCGLWYYGAPGTGKSRMARELFGDDLYLKSQNKWWDGYVGQTSVLLDDLDKGGICLSHLLKIWCDRYACTGEIKGGQVSLCYERFIVTSNYSIKDLYGEDEEVVKALERRFKVVKFSEFPPESSKKMSYEERYAVVYGEEKKKFKK